MQTVFVCTSVFYDHRGTKNFRKMPRRGLFFATFSFYLLDAICDFFWHQSILSRGRKPCERCERRLQVVMRFCRQSQLLSKKNKFVRFSRRQKIHCIHCAGRLGILFSQSNPWLPCVNFLTCTHIIWFYILIAEVLCIIGTNHMLLISIPRLAICE